MSPIQSYLVACSYFFRRWWLYLWCKCEQSHIWSVFINVRLAAYTPTEFGCVSSFLAPTMIKFSYAVLSVGGYLHGFLGYFVVRLTDFLNICIVCLPISTLGRCCRGRLRYGQNMMTKALKLIMPSSPTAGMGMGNLLPLTVGDFRANPLLSSLNL
jgi:hypothetical protein